MQIGYRFGKFKDNSRNTINPVKAQSENNALLSKEKYLWYHTIKKYHTIISLRWILVSDGICFLFPAISFIVFITVHTVQI